MIYALVIEAPESIDPLDWEEIEEAASGHDATQEAKIRRWLGDKVNDAESDLSESLPEGWTARIFASAD